MENKKEAAAQQKYQDNRKKALSDLLVNHPEAAKRLNQENFEVGGRLIYVVYHYSRVH